MRKLTQHELATITGAQPLYLDIYEDKTMAIYGLGEGDIFVLNGIVFTTYNYFDSNGQLFLNVPQETNGSRIVNGYQVKNDRGAYTLSPVLR